LAIVGIEALAFTSAGAELVLVGVMAAGARHDAARLALCLRLLAIVTSSGLGLRW
jgi:hypothetical protein